MIHAGLGTWPVCPLWPKSTLAAKLLDQNVWAPIGSPGVATRNTLPTNGSRVIPELSSGIRLVSAVLTCVYIYIYIYINIERLCHSEASQFNVPTGRHMSNKVVLGRFPYSDTPTFCTTMWLAALCSGSLISLALARLQKHVAMSMSCKESQYRITCNEQLKQMVEHPPFKFHQFHPMPSVPPDLGVSEASGHSQKVAHLSVLRGRISL